MLVGGQGQIKLDAFCFKIKPLVTCIIIRGHVLSWLLVIIKLLTLSVCSWTDHCVSLSLTQPITAQPVSWHPLTCTCPQHRAKGEGKGKQIGVEGEKYTLLVKKNTLKSPGGGCRESCSVDPPKYHCWYKKKGTKLYLPRNNPDRSPTILYSLKVSSRLRALIQS